MLIISYVWALSQHDRGISEWGTRGRQPRQEGASPCRPPLTGLQGPFQRGSGSCWDRRALHRGAVQGWGVVLLWSPGSQEQGRGRAGQGPGQGRAALGEDLY